MIVFDLSRLLSRAGRVTPSGIDRVELAYAEHLIAESPGVCFAAMTAWGRLGLLPRRGAQSYVEAIAGTWRDGPRSAPGRARVRQLARRLRLQALLAGPAALDARLRAAGARAGGAAPVYLLVSHHHLDRRRVIAGLKRRSGARFVCLVHDLIPIEFPEYARPGQDLRHRRRIATAAALGDALIVGSTAVRDALQPHLERAGRIPPVLTAPFGVELPGAPARAPQMGLAVGPAAGSAGAAQPDAPYFVCLGTIEARKNQLLLLDLWRGLAEERSGTRPRLLLIGERGWQSENAIGMIERCPALRGSVIECRGLCDTGMEPLLRGARALLLPSFAEGFGLPLAEALALGVPALCSDIPALRANGGEVPEYFDPRDLAGWRSAVLDYASTPSARREAQLRRLGHWRPPSWQDHFAAVEALIAQTATLPDR